MQGAFFLSIFNLVLLSLLLLCDAFNKLENSKAAFKTYDVVAACKIFTSLGLQF